MVTPLKTDCFHKTQAKSLKTEEFWAKTSIRAKLLLAIVIIFRSHLSKSQRWTQIISVTSVMKLTKIPAQRRPTRTKSLPSTARSLRTVSSSIKIYLTNPTTKKMVASTNPIQLARFETLKTMKTLKLVHSPTKPTSTTSSLTAISKTSWVSKISTPQKLYLKPKRKKCCKTSLFARRPICQLIISNRPRLNWTIILINLNNIWRAKRRKFRLLRSQIKSWWRGTLSFLMRSLMINQLLSERCQYIKYWRTIVLWGIWECNLSYGFSI